MTKFNPRARLEISADDLEYVARCPRSFYYLDRIRSSIVCKNCDGLSAAGRYMLQRSFRGTRLPTLDFLTKIYAQSISGVPEQPWAIHHAHRQKAVLDHLRDWGKGVWEKIDSVGMLAETHHGQFTIKQVIDVILKIDERYILGQFSCDFMHPEQVIHYRTLHASLWMRESYGIEANDVMIIRLTAHGPEFNTQPLALSTKTLREAVHSILSKVDIGIHKTIEERDLALAALPPNPGEHCHVCMSCFEGQEMFNE